jgi:hypothetical protein
MNAGRRKARTFGILAGGCLLLGCVAASAFPKEAIPLALAGLVGYVFTGRSAMRAWNADAIVFEPPAAPPVIAPSAVERGLLGGALGWAALGGVSRSTRPDSSPDSRPTRPRHSRPRRLRPVPPGASAR